MSIKYRLKEVAADFGVTTKEVSTIMEKFFEKPKSNTQVLTDAELNCIFDYMTKEHNPIENYDQWLKNGFKNGLFKEENIFSTIDALLDSPTDYDNFFANLFLFLKYNFSTYCQNLNRYRLHQ